MSAASNYLEQELLDHVLRNEAYSSPAAVYLALFTSPVSPGATTALLEDGDITNEVGAGVSYARQTATFEPATTPGGSSTTAATITFDACTGTNWGTITHVAIMDASSAGNVLFYGAVTTPKLIEINDIFQVTNGNLTITLA